MKNFEDDRIIMRVLVECVIVYGLFHLVEVCDADSQDFHREQEVVEDDFGCREQLIVEPPPLARLKLITVFN